MTINYDINKKVITSGTVIDITELEITSASEVRIFTYFTTDLETIVDLVVNVDYTLSLDLKTATLGTALAANQVAVASYSLNKHQTVNLVNSNSLDVTNINIGLDSVTRKIKQLWFDVARSLKVSRADSKQITLADTTGQGGKYLKVNAIDSTVIDFTSTTSPLTGSQIVDLIDGEDLSTVVTSARVDAAGATMNADTNVKTNGWVIDEDNMTSNLDTKVPTQQSVKAYVDAAAPLTFKTIAVSGQSDVVADSAADTLTLAAGTGITLTTNAGTDTVTITNSVTAPNTFGTIAVSGQSDVVADSPTDTLTLVAGANVTLTTNAGTDTVTISSSISGGTVGDGDYGDVVVTSSGTVYTIDAGVISTGKIANDAVTYAKIQNVTQDTILGRATASTGDVEEIACTAAGRAIIDDVSATAQRTTLGLGTSAVIDTGTSGTKIPLLDGANTWSGVQSHNDGTLALKGLTSGTTTIKAAATAGTTTITLPAGTTDFSATGGTSKFVKQASVGAALTVAQVSDADLSVTDVTTNNVTSSAHGFAPKGDGTTTKFLNANGAYSTPAAGGGSGVHTMFKGPNGVYVDNIVLATTQTVGIISYNASVTCVPFIPSATFTLAELNIRVSSAAGSGKHIMFGIYDSDGTNNTPKTKLVGSTEQDANTPATMTLGSLSQVLTAGHLYWLTCASDANVTGQAVAATSALALPEATAFQNQTTRYTSYIATRTYDSTLPSDISALTFTASAVSIGVFKLKIT